MLRSIMTNLQITLVNLERFCPEIFFLFSFLLVSVFYFNFIKRQGHNFLFQTNFYLRVK